MKINENETTTCECNKVVGLVLDLLVHKGHITGLQALSAMEEMSSCSFFFEDEVHASYISIARVMVHALEELWLDIDDAIEITAFLADIPETAALQLLV